MRSEQPKQQVGRKKGERGEAMVFGADVWEQPVLILEAHMDQMQHIYLS